MRALILILGSGCGRLAFDAVPDEPPRSCITLAPTCGPDGTTDCCESPVVPGGTWFRGHDMADDAVHRDSRFAATVSRFRLDSFEITVGRFRAFVDAGMGTQQTPPQPGDGAHRTLAESGWDPSWNDQLPIDSAALVAQLGGTWTGMPGANENRPLTNLSWYLAMAFCIWDGGYLPSEAEWHFAASGGDEQRAYPWSTPPSSITIDETIASYWKDISNKCFGDALPGCTNEDFVPVGSKPAGRARWGHYELGGNVSEWVLDTFDSIYPMPCTDCASLTARTARVVRGGGYATDVSLLRSAERYSTIPHARNSALGARCARPTRS